MILVADSGSTKTDWILLPDSMSTRVFRTAGLNPYYLDKTGIRNVVEKELVPFIDPGSVTSIHFYGAGCSLVSKAMQVEEVLQDTFPEADTEVLTDLLGAARALFGRQPGIACILGTGSNSCYYDGYDIAANIPSLGYILGDEGGGAFMGKTFFRDYLLGELPEEIGKAFAENYSLNRESILDAVYNQPSPNRFLASITDFYLANIEHPYIRRLVAQSFDAFLLNQVKRYPGHERLPVSFVGSVAFYFDGILKEVAAGHRIAIVQVLKSAAEGLAEYHRHEAGSGRQGKTF
jgi:hypothetical protein